MMAEQFEGPVIVTRPAGQPPSFEVAKFDGDVGLDGTVKTTHVSAQGNVSALGNVNAGATVNANLVALNSEVPPDPVPGGAGTNVPVRTVLKCHADDILGVIHLRAEGNISAQNNVNAKNIHVTEDVILENSDCAEEFDLEDSSPGEPLPGSVMVIGDEGSVRLSTSAYDKRVAGVISGAGAFKPGIILDRRNSDSSRPAVALMGKVFCKTDTTNGPIEVGDLLTTSGTAGHAMKAADPFKAFGAVLGKALRPLKEGQGLIPILVTLQ